MKSYEELIYSLIGLDQKEFRQYSGVPGKSEEITDSTRERRVRGDDHPPDAYSMIGLYRMENARDLAQECLDKGIQGDFVECGVWRGGVIMLWAEMLKEANKRKRKNRRKVWGFDSFQGNPVPNPEKYPLDEYDLQHKTKHLAVSEAAVEQNFKEMGISMRDVKLVPGFFSETLAPDSEYDLPKKIAVLRLDCGTQEAYTQCLGTLWDRVSPGGFLIADDYGLSEGAKVSIDSLAEQEGLSIKEIDWVGVYLQKRPKYGLKELDG